MQIEELNGLPNVVSPIEESISNDPKDRCQALMRVMQEQATNPGRKCGPSISVLLEGDLVVKRS